MNKIITLHIVLFCTALFFPTKQFIGQKIVKFDFDDFPETVEKKGELLNLEMPLGNPYLIQITDSLLILNNNGTSPAFDVIDINTGKTISHFCNRGRGPGELIGPNSYQYIKENNEIMVHDAQMRKLIFYGLNLIIENKPKKFTRIIDIDRNILVRKIQQVKEGNFFCDLIGHDDGYMNCLIDKKGNFIRFLNKYPKLDKPFNTLIGSNLFSTTIGVSPNKERVILPYTDSDIIEIFDYNGNCLYKLIGPNYKKLDVFYSKNSEALTNRNNIAFHAPSVGNNGFMVTYTGIPYKNASNPGQHILYFSMEGQLLKHFIVIPAVTNIAVDWENNTIYGINKDLEPAIYKYHF